MQKIEYQALVDLNKAQVDADRALAKSESDAEIASQAAFYGELAKVAEGSLDRSRAAAEAVRTAAAAIGVIYGAILGVAFSVDRPLPARGVIPALFLGISIVFATAYVAFLFRQTAKIAWPDERSQVRVENQRHRIGTFIQWIQETVYARAYALRTSVIALGFAVVFLPIGFLTLGQTASEGNRALTPWPVPSNQGLANPELAKILYQAQVGEVANERQAEANAGGGSSGGPIWVWIAALVAAGVTFLVPALWSRSVRKSPVETALEGLQMLAKDPRDVPAVRRQAILDQVSSLRKDLEPLRPRKGS